MRTSYDEFPWFSRVFYVFAWRVKNFDLHAEGFALDFYNVVRISIRACVHCWAYLQHEQVRQVTQSPLGRSSTFHASSRQQIWKRLTSTTNIRPPTRTQQVLTTPESLVGPFHYRGGKDRACHCYRAERIKWWYGHFYREENDEYGCIDWISYWHGSIFRPWISVKKRGLVPNAVTLHSKYINTYPIMSKARTITHPWSPTNFKKPFTSG